MKSLLAAFDFSRVSRILALVSPLALALVATALWLNPALSMDEIAASVAIPLMISYLLVRGVIWLVSDVPEATPEEAEAMKRLQDSNPGHTVVLSGKLGFALAIAFVSGMWALATAVLSLAIYELMGLSWAASMAIAVLRFIFWVVAVSAVFICLMNLCKPWLLKMALFFRSVFHFPLAGHHRRAAT